MIGFPVLIRWLLEPSGETRTPWRPLVVVALLGLVVPIDHVAEAPRPELDKQVGKQRWQGARASAPRVGTRRVPVDPDVRTAAGVLACCSIEGLMAFGAMLLGLFPGELVRPVFPWWTFVCGAVGDASGSTFRDRRGWACPTALHAEPRTE